MIRTMAQKKPSRKPNKKAKQTPNGDGFMTESAFLEKHSIPKAQYNSTGLKWVELRKIYSEFVSNRPAMERQAIAIAAILLSQSAREKGVHSVRYRIKEGNSLVEKIIRDRIENPANPQITIENYKERITDLIGVRVLHTFQNDHSGIHDFLMETFAIKHDKKPVAYYRDGDDEEFVDVCAGLGCDKRKHGKGYRSVHYVIATQLTKEVHYAEVQVRTIFQEGWSEIDHKMRYNHKLAASGKYEKDLSDLNSASALADSLATKLKNRHEEELRKRWNATTKPGKWKS